MFWFLVTLLTLLAVAFLLLPLMRRDISAGEAQGVRSAFNVSLYQREFDELESRRGDGSISEEHYQQRQGELSRRLLADTDAVSHSGLDKSGPDKEGDTGASESSLPARGALLAVLGVLLPLAAVAIYWQLGSWDAQRMMQRVEQASTELAEGEADSSAMISLLGDLARFNEGRDQPDWLYLQAQTAMRVGAYPVAASIFSRLSALEPGNADIVGQQVQALYLARGRKLDGEIEGLIERTLAINPHQSTVLGIRGMNAFESGNYEVAVKAWGQALAGLPPGSASATMLRRGIAQARSAAGGMPRAPVAAAPGTDGIVDAVGFGQGIKVSVELDNAAQVAPGSTVFVIASPPEGGMPFAVVRLPVEGLPTQVLLDDSTAMAPGRSLSRQREVKITARVSRSGNAIGQAGDWQGRSEVMTPGTVPPIVAIRIDQQI